MGILKTWPVFNYGCKYEFTSQTLVFSKIISSRKLDILAEGCPTMETGKIQAILDWQWQYCLYDDCSGAVGVA